MNNSTEMRFTKAAMKNTQSHHVKKSLITAIIASSLLTACELDQSDKNNETNAIENSTLETSALTGQLQLPQVQGLSYQTESQAGELVDGNFNYQEGETLSLYLGQQKLISLTAQQVIALYQANAASIEWPTSEDALNEAYFESSFESSTDSNSETEAATEAATEINFQILANLNQLIHNLDLDADASNGFDLSRFSDIQPSTAINLATSLDDFYQNELLQLAHDIGSTRQVSPITSINYLYQQADKTIAILERSEKVVDEENDQVIDERYSYQYSEEGLPLGYEKDSNSDDITDRSDVYSYNDQGLQTSNDYENDSDYDGTVNSSNGYGYQYNEYNQLNSESFYTDYNGDGTNDYTTESQYQYDNQGNILVEVIGSDYDQDGTWDEQETTTNSYNDSGLITEKLRSDDEDLDGTTDSTKRYTYSYNENNDLSLEIRYDDDDADGSIEDRRETTYTYNADNQQIGETVQDIEGSIEDDAIGYNTQKTYTYDDAGNQVSEEYTVDYYGDGEANFKSLSEHQYDENNNLIQWVSTTYQDGQSISQINQYDYSYDQDQQRTSYSKSSDSDGDSTFDSKTSYRYEYDDQGNTTRLTIENDTDFDSEIDETEIQDYSYQTREDGVKAIVQEFIGNYWSA